MELASFGEEQTDFIVCCYNIPLGHVCPASGPAWLPSLVPAASFLLDPFVSRTFSSFRSQMPPSLRSPPGSQHFLSSPASLIPLCHQTTSLYLLSSLSAGSLLFLNLPGALSALPETSALGGAGTLCVMCRWHSEC